MYFSFDRLELSDGSRIVFSSTSKREIVRIGESVISMIDGIISKKYHYDYNNRMVRAFINTSAKIYALLDIYDVCPKVRLIKCIFDYVSNVAALFADKPYFESFTLDEKGNFKFTY